MQCGTLELNEASLKRLSNLNIGGIDVSAMEALKLRLSTADDTTSMAVTTAAAAMAATTAPVTTPASTTMAEIDSSLSKLSLETDTNSDSDSGYDLGDGEEDASLISTSLGGSLSSRSSVTGGSTESLHLAVQQQQQQQQQLQQLQQQQQQQLEQQQQQQQQQEQLEQQQQLQQQQKELIEQQQKRYAVLSYEQVNSHLIYFQLFMIIGNPGGAQNPLNNQTIIASSGIEFLIVLPILGESSAD